MSKARSLEADITHKKIGIFSFGDGSLGYRRAARRVAQQAEGFKDLGNSLAVNKRNIETSFPSESHLINWKDRGFGYWAWKPLALEYALKTFGTEIDVLCYVDAGCWVNVTSSSKERLGGYTGACENSGALTFSSGDGNLDAKFCKKELVEEMTPLPLHLNTTQRAATLWLLHRDLAADFARRWWELASNHSLINDSFDSEIQDSRFLAHRHDQSIFSLLAKGDGFPISSDKIDIHPANTVIGAQEQAIPFWASRHRSGSLTMSMNPIRRAARAAESIIP
jgi:hypothetical protein